jgi:hypothetical protein
MQKSQKFIDPKRIALYFEEKIQSIFIKNYEKRRI